MAAVFGKIDKFYRDKEDWSNYVERLTQSQFSHINWGKQYVVKVVQRPSEKGNFNVTPSKIAQWFKFHSRFRGQCIFLPCKIPTAYTWNSNNWDAIFLNFKLWNAQISILVNKLWILVACSFQFLGLQNFGFLESNFQFLGLENFGFWVLFQFIGLHAILVCMYCCTCTLMENLPKICRLV